MQQQDPTNTDDTSPIRAIHEPIPTWRRLIGAFTLLGALVFTAATTILIITAPDNSIIPSVPPATTNPDDIALPTLTPTIEAEQLIVTDATQAPPLVSDNPILPTLDPAAYAAILNAPMVSISDERDAQDIAISRDIYEPFTFVPDRPRSEVIQYTVQQGDTMFGIAERFGITAESIAWSNDRSIIGGLRPGRQINIPPVDGAYVQIAVDTTIQDLADRFRVEAIAIIDSEFNDLFGASPSTVLRPGIWVFIPGGQAEAIVWSAPVTRTGGNAQSGGAGAQISFGVGEPGSCGLVDNPGGGAQWFNPLPGGYTWMRGFTSYHTGVDLAVPIGTAVVAANSGTVIFRGWSDYGYGYAVVLAHGPFTTVYGHLSSFNVGCGQYVNGGSTIAFSGSSGNSSGPHLHFEIRYNDIVTDPAATMPF